MIPKIVHLTAKTKDLTWEENRLMRKNQRLLSDYQFILRDDADNEKMVKEYFPQYYDKYMSISRGVAKADVARVMYMYVWGGWYIDTDYKFFKDPCKLQELKEARVVAPISREEMDAEGFKLGNAIFAAIPGQQLWLDFLNEIFSSQELFDIKENRIELVTGPDGFTAFYEKQNKAGKLAQYEGLVTPQRKYFHPQRETSESYGRHFCWGSWRTKNVKNNVKMFIRRKVQAL